MAYTQGRSYRHSGPRRITITRIVLLLVAVAVVYATIIFVPPFWRYYKASAIMTEEAQNAYRKRRTGHSWAQIQSNVHRQVQGKLLEALKIPEQDLRLEVEKRDGSVYVTAKWISVARWPIIGKTTTMRFKEEVYFGTR